MILQIAGQIVPAFSLVQSFLTYKSNFVVLYYLYMAFLSPTHLVEALAIPYGSVVADFGSGPGAYITALKRAVGPAGKVFAVDIHKESLFDLTKLVGDTHEINVDVVWADIEKKLPFDNYFFDGGVISNVLSQVEDRRNALSNIKQTLKPGSPLLVVDWLGSFDGVGPHKDNVFKDIDCELLLQSLGFRIVRRLPAGDFHYAIVALS